LREGVVPEQASSIECYADFENQTNAGKHLQGILYHVSASSYNHLDVW
jgi:hypothetical protein